MHCMTGPNFGKGPLCRMRSDSVHDLMGQATHAGLDLSAITDMELASLACHEAAGLACQMTVSVGATHGKTERAVRPHKIVQMHGRSEDVSCGSDEQSDICSAMR